MYFVYLAAVLGCLWGNTLAGYSQFFYTGLPAPVPQNYYQTPYQHAFQTFSPAPAFYNPVPQFYTHSGFAYHHTSPVKYTQVQDNNNDQARVNEDNDSVEVSAEPVATTQAPAAAARSFNFERKESDAFRGFAYHNEYDNGARSNVVFLTGPEIHRYNSLTTKSVNTHTPASDAIDSNALKEETQVNEANPSIRVLMNFLENPQVGVQKFYSVDNTLVARRLEDDYPSFPASTLPLSAPISPVFSILRSNFNPGQYEKTEEVMQRSNPEPLALSLESHASFNSIDAGVTTATTTTTTIAPTTTEAVSSTTEAASSTTEAASSTTEAASSTTEAASSTTEAASSTTEETSSTTEAASSTQETNVESTTSMAPIVVEDTTGDSNEEESSS